MTTQYLIRKVETCPVCEGTSQLYNPEWAELNEAFDDIRRNQTVDDAFSLFDQMVRAKWPFGREPPEEVPCHECEGTGKAKSWIPLQRAMHELAELATADDDGPA